MSISSVSSERSAVDVRVDDESLRVIFSDGTQALGPLSYSRRLQNATPEQRRNWRWLGRHSGIHWPDVDEDLSVLGIIR